MKSAQFLVLIVLAAVFIPLSFFSDVFVSQLFTQLSHPVLDIFFQAVSSLWVLLGVFVVVPMVVLLLRNKPSSVVTLGAAFLFSVGISSFLKLFLERARPVIPNEPFIDLLSYSFPSSHTMVCFGTLPVLILLFPKLRNAFISLAIVIATSRLYVQAHYFSDVIAGVFFGLFVGLLFVHPHLRSIVNHQPFFELKRKIAHIAFGLFLIAVVYYELFSLHLLLAVLVLGSGLILLARTKKLPIINTILNQLERRQYLNTFPGKGLFYFVLGTYAVFLLFDDKSIVIASLAILTFGDSLSHLYGVHFGTRIHPLDDKKFLEGAWIGFLAGFFAAVVFVSPLEAFVASLVAMIVEGIEVKQGEFFFDDNFTIILAAGFSIVVVRLLF